MRVKHPERALHCAVHNEPLVGCPCQATPGVVPAVFKVKPVVVERNEEFKEWVSKPRD